MATTKRKRADEDEDYIDWEGLTEVSPTVNKRFSRPPNSPISGHSQSTPSASSSRKQAVDNDVSAPHRSSPTEDDTRDATGLQDESERRCPMPVVLRMPHRALMPRGDGSGGITQGGGRSTPDSVFNFELVHWVGGQDTGQDTVAPAALQAVDYSARPTQYQNQGAGFALTGSVFPSIETDSTHQLSSVQPTVNRTKQVVRLPIPPSHCSTKHPTTIQEDPKTSTSDRSLTEEELRKLSAVKLLADPDANFARAMEAAAWLHTERVNDVAERSEVVVRHRIEVAKLLGSEGRWFLRDSFGRNRL